MPQYAKWLPVAGILYSFIYFSPKRIGLSYLIGCLVKHIISQADLFVNAPSTTEAPLREGGFLDGIYCHRKIMGSTTQSQIGTKLKREGMSLRNI